MNSKSEDVKKISNKSNLNKNITKRYDGRSFRVRMAVHGVPIQATFDTIEDARAYRDRMLADATLDPTHRLVIEARQNKIGAEKDTLGVLLTRYKKEVSTTKKGVRAEKLRIDMIQRYEISRLPLAMVNRDAVLRFIKQIRKYAIASDGSVKTRPLSDCTLRKYLMLLSAFYGVANKRWGLNVSNPVREVEMPGNGTPRERRIEPGEFELIIIEIRSSHPILELLLLSIETACRLGELLNLMWKDVNLDVQIAVLRETKNNETRIIPLSLLAVDILSTLQGDIKGKVFQISVHSISSA
ncbi:MAG: tyrosine-type recombinase/integrase, partial [Burkholderiaceae bacterium]